jgi:hypothetical protein
MNENEMGNRGSKSAILKNIVIFSFFISLIITLPVGHFDGLSIYNSILFVTASPSFYNKNFSFSALSVNRKNYSTDCSVVPVKIYKNSDLDKFQISKDAKGKSGVYR